MKIDAPINPDMSQIGAAARDLEAAGFDGVRLAELNHDPFMPLAIAAEHTTSIELVTSVAVAFARDGIMLRDDFFKWAMMPETMLTDWSRRS